MKADVLTIPKMWYFSSFKGFEPELLAVKVESNFDKSARFQVPKNGTSGAEQKKRRPLFVANYPPKWCTARLFYAFSTFGWVLSQFKNLAFFGLFSPSKSTMVPKKLPPWEGVELQRKQNVF